MGALDQAEAQRLQNAHLGLATYTAPTTPMRLATFTVIGSAAATGTESTGGSYARQSLASAFPASSTNGSITNSAGAVSFTGMPASTVVAVEIFDSNGTPRRAAWGALSANKTLGAGDTLTFPTSSITENINA